MGMRIPRFYLLRHIMEPFASADGEEKPDGVKIVLTRREHQVWKFMQSHGPVTRADVAKHVGVTSHYASSILRSIHLKGYARYASRGSGPGGMDTFETTGVEPPLSRRRYKDDGKGGD